MNKIDPEVIRKVVNELPVAGDTLIDFDGDYAIYKSGGKVRIESGSRLKKGDIVDGVYHGIDGQKIIINVDHVASESIQDYKEYVKIERKYRLIEIGKAVKSIIP